MSYLNNVNKIIDSFNKYQIEYMIIGCGSAIIQGFNATTQDIDIYPKNSAKNNRRIILALTEDLRIKLTDKETNDIQKGKDFVQLNYPIELDLIFSPDGFENYEEALKYKTNIGKYPVMNLEGIIKSKKSTNRKKDKLQLLSLVDFSKFLKNRKEKYYFCKGKELFDIPFGYKITDKQTINRWISNIKNFSIEERLEKGILG